VVGSPLGSSQGPHCAPPGIRLLFGEAQFAITGQVDELGRREILIKTTLNTQLGSAVPEPVSDLMTRFVNPDDENQIYGHSASHDGCVFAKVYAPPQAAGRTVRLVASLLTCAPEMPTAEMNDAVMTAALKLSLGPGVAVGTSDVVLPAETAVNTLDDCGFVSVSDQIRQDWLNQEMVKKQIERHQQQEEEDSSPSRPYRDDLILKPSRP
jgi:hypothetical protein